MTPVVRVMDGSGDSSRAASSAARDSPAAAARSASTVSIVGSVRDCTVKTSRPDNAPASRFGLVIGEDQGDLLVQVLLRVIELVPDHGRRAGNFDARGRYQLHSISKRVEEEERIEHLVLPFECGNRHGII